jgi:hypothetical protein
LAAQLTQADAADGQQMAAAALWEHAAAPTARAATQITSGRLGPEIDLPNGRGISLLRGPVCSGSHATC